MAEVVTRVDEVANELENADLLNCVENLRLRMGDNKHLTRFQRQNPP